MRLVVDEQARIAVAHPCDACPAPGDHEALPGPVGRVHEHPAQSFAVRDRHAPNPAYTGGGPADRNRRSSSLSVPPSARIG